MQIVIDIDDDVYNDIKSGKNITNIILNGTILPKYHGRLIDADAFKKKVCTYQQTGCGSCKHSLCCPEDVPTIIEADKNITYQPVDDYKECNFYKDGKEKDLSDVDISKFYDYYKPPYRDNPFREGRMSGLWGEYEYYCPKCNLEITKVFYDNEHIRVGDCSKCPIARRVIK